MSRSSTELSRRSVSEDTSQGKRTADDDETSTLSERPKRVRRDGSYPQFGEEQDTNVVASRHDVEKADFSTETKARAAPSPQPSQVSSLSSPLSSAPSRLADDCGEMAQKTVEVWQKSTGPSNSDPNRQDFPGRTNKRNERRIAVSPKSPGDSSADGSRNWLSGDERYRTPLPTQKESHQQDTVSTRTQHPSASSLPTPAQYPVIQNGPQHQSTDQASRNRQSFSSEISERSSNHSDDYLRTIAKDTIQMSVRDAPKWQAAETRQLPPLPSIGVQFPGMGRNSISQLLGQPPQIALSTFPSTFSVLTAEEIQRNQESNKASKRRGKQPPDPLGIHGRGEDRSNPTMPSPRDALSKIHLSRQEQKSDYGSPRSSPDFRHLNLHPSTRRPASEASNMPQIHHVIRPRDAATPPLSAGPNTPYQPPPVTFTIDNRAESPLPGPDVQPYLETFTQNAAVILPFTAKDKEPTSHPINMIMWQTLDSLYKWYLQTLQIQAIGPLMFELIDVHWQEERSFVVPEGNQNYFRIMKQYVWDLHWFAVNINKGPAPFRVVITRFTPPDQRSPRKLDGQWISPNNKLGGSPGRRSGTDPRDHIILDSKPGPLYTYQQSRPPSLTPNTIPQSRSSTAQRQNLEDVKSKSRRNSFNSNQASTEDHRRQSAITSSPPSPHLRTVHDQTMLRERAHAYLTNRPDVQLLSHESTVLDKLPYKTGSEVDGVIIDKRSGKGMVAITGKGYITLNVKTGPEEVGRGEERYQEVAIQPKQTCMLHGEAVVLFYKRVTPDSMPGNGARVGSEGSARGDGEIDIQIRVQISPTGKFSQPFDKSVLRPRITTTEFFSFFSQQSNHCPPPPGGYQRNWPERLRFTFKDALPNPITTEIARGNEDHFNYMRKDIKAQCEKARKFLGDLREFVILVTVPGWEEGEKEDEW